MGLASRGRVAHAGLELVAQEDPQSAELVRGGVMEVEAEEVEEEAETGRVEAIARSRSERPDATGAPRRCRTRGSARARIVQRLRCCNHALSDTDRQLREQGFPARGGPAQREVISIAALARTARLP